MIGIAQTISRTSSRAPRRLSAKINLIPYNTVEGLKWSRPSRARQEKFQSILREHGVIATLRREKGHDIAAACGQLRLQTKQWSRITNRNAVIIEKVSVSVTRQ